MDGRPVSACGELFLVELTARDAASDAVAMHRALHQAVRRLAAGGVPIGWCSALLLPDGHCLCLVQAAALDDVALACDTAALPVAAVRPARLL
ncbi:hypothetical protein [Modestobacter altitudinis]|uniref:hypothetical protein n=1 Tax=Modestobacter altitudinis TaxID=2213158 RepID=UPI00110C9407|nr:hypothetical protein [Modestobacter altitudinis]